MVMNQEYDSFIIGLAVLVILQRKDGLVLFGLLTTLTFYIYLFGSIWNTLMKKAYTRKLHGQIYNKYMYGLVD